MSQKIYCATLINKRIKPLPFKQTVHAQSVITSLLIINKSKR